MLTDYRVRQRDYLLQIARALTSRLNLNEVLGLILRQTTDLLASHAALIALVDEDGVYRVRQAYGIAEPLLERIRALPPLKGDLRRAVHELERQLVELAFNFGLGRWQVIAMPLVLGKDEFLGAIYAFRRRGAGFGADEYQLLRSFADQAAIAVNNARLYEQLVQEKRRLDAILEFSADGIAILDSAHYIQMFNRALSRMLGIHAEQALGRRFEEIVVLVNKRSGMTLAEAEAGGWPLVSDAPAVRVEGDLRRADGSTLSVEMAFTALFNARGRLVNIIVAVHDLTRFRLAEEMKATFIAAVSHELKTPVALIKGYASTLLRTDAQWSEQTLRESLKVIEEEADRLSELIENLLDASRAQAGRFRIAPVELDLAELIPRVVQKFQTQSPSHQFAVSLASDLPLVYADEARITQVLSNLISNAVKYSPPGSKVQVSARATPTEVIISVSDEGLGIPREEQERIFERFYRGENATRRGTPGTGLGLYLTRIIVEAHGGRIWVESDGKSGSTFHVALPRMAAG
ncbi:MAG: ATP-binding protein [Thermoflexales bacterium]|nr:ATP-binding protein [Thermoflexales bacterium]MCX7939033.1 ATP-binding protein [Thermoflexales bacterium]MDW8292327.1 ATP-binding protein [Anaerolineae bacterium]